MGGTKKKKIDSSKFKDSKERVLNGAIKFREMDEDSFARGRSFVTFAVLENVEKLVISVFLFFSFFLFFFNFEFKRWKRTSLACFFW